MTLFPCFLHTYNLEILYIANIFIENVFSYMFGHTLKSYM